MADEKKAAPKSAASKKSTSKSKPKSSAKKTTKSRSKAKKSAKGKAKAKAKKAGATRTKKTAGAKKASATRAKASSRASAATSGLDKSVAQFRESLEHSVTLSRDRIQEVVDDAVTRGRMTRGDAEKMVRELIKKGKKQTDSMLGELEKFARQARKKLP